MALGTRIGVDLGGTKIEAALLAGDGAITERRRVPTPQGNYAAIIAAIADLVREMEERAGERCSVGVGTPGAISSRTGTLKNSNSTVLNGRRVKQDLEDALARSIRTSNDANCFALSEVRGGSAEGARVVFGVILGTGVGGGIVVDGRAIEGANGIAGEWGHNPLPWPSDGERPGPQCYCGKNGCIETYLCGPAFARAYAERTGCTLEPTEIARRSRDESAAHDVFEGYVGRLARSLAAVINVLDPDVVVFGGGVSRIGELYGAVAQSIGRWIFSDRVETKFSSARFGDSSGVRGAAMLWNIGEND